MSSHPSLQTTKHTVTLWGRELGKRKRDLENGRDWCNGERYVVSFYSFAKHCLPFETGEVDTVNQLWESVGNGRDWEGTWKTRVDLCWEFVDDVATCHRKKTRRRRDGNAGTLVTVRRKA